jgi:formylglycine-generating enzyme required for sulfatase activity/archaellum component FlaG (FlaF/FlaG flagellin family)
MSGKNLTYTYIIRDHKGERLLSEQDFPLIIGCGSEADINTSDLQGNEEIAYIGFSRGHPFVQPAQPDNKIIYNNESLTESVWLFHDDRLTLGSTEIHLHVDQDRVIFEVTGSEAYEKISILPEAVQDIEPVHFRRSFKKGKKISFLQKLLRAAVALIFTIVIATASWLIVSYNRVHIQITPEPDSITVSTKSFIPSLMSLYFLKSGTYKLRAEKRGYYPLEQTLTVNEEKMQSFNFTMEKLPGILTITAHEEGKLSVSIKGAHVYINNKKTGKTPLEKVKVQAGRVKVEIRAGRYHDSEKTITVQGEGQSQSLTFALKSALGNVTIRSEPKGADVLIDGRHKGKTPLNIKLAPGRYKLKVSADRYKSFTKRFVVKANKPLIIDDIQLEKLKGKLALLSIPSGASVHVGEKYRGKTPLNISLFPDVTHTVTVSKDGYERVERQVLLSPGSKEKISLELTALKGVVSVEVEPHDAELLIDGTTKGRGGKELTLTAVKHEIEVRKEGYKPYKGSVIPDPQSVKKFKISLEKEYKDLPKAQETEKEIYIKGIIRASNGYRLILVRPSAFTMGSSRRQQGRRSNETFRKVVLKRPFYMGTKEVTNKEFREFLRSHHSGDYKGYSLNRGEQPVVQVTWQEAAQFCNWLSEKDSLPPAYVSRGGKLVAAEPLTTGYRLPTEAEWEYCVRFNGTQATLKYPWGGTFPPQDGTVNIADKSAKTLLKAVIETYDDGFPAAAPSGVFRPNSLGLYDMGGNVSEWCHDFYTIYPYSTNKTYKDPTGPGEGKHRVVRGASWKDSSISMLRSAYRDYSSEKREDLGFRLCRYAEP